ncbi:MAG TPA: FHA domain-containing protein, partial [Thermoanaerobaculia bacterium]|nr:FHA domain-containing protein [Thermoanaerobaculia bacterium]
MLRLRYVVNDEDRAISLTGGRVRLGRGSDNDLVLADVSVSRYHAEILREAEGWSVHDLKSTNGVDVNGVPVEKASLRSGDVLSIGSFEIRVEAEEPQSVRPKAAKDDGEGGFGNATIIRPLSVFAADYGLGQPAAIPPVGAGTEEQAYVHRMFGFLTRLARVLTVADSVDQVLSRVLELAFEAFPVDRGFIL